MLGLSRDYAGFSNQLKRSIAPPTSAGLRILYLVESLDLLTPPWLRLSIITPLPIDMTLGTIIKYRIRTRGVPVRWESEIYS